MRAAIITIGDELLIGQIVDTNSTYISQQLGSIGFVVEQKRAIGDSADKIIESVGEAMGRYDLVIVTGGLGPTKDDITKECFAKLFGCGMRRDESVSEHVRTLLANRGIEYNELNHAQSMVPECCEVLFNRHGTAPGMWFTDDNSVMISLPGVPFEMKGLMTDEVLPRLKERFKLKPTLHRTMITASLPESLLAKRIESWEDALPSEIKLAYLPNAKGVRLRLSSYEVADIDATNSLFDKLFRELEGIIAGHVVGYEGATVESLIHTQLLQREETLAVAESCTGGALAAKFTAMAGASNYFNGGVVAYSNEAKMSLLGVKRGTLEQFGAVSEEVAIEMADGVRKAMNSTYAIATTGIAGPTGGSEEKPIGTVWFALSTPNGCYASTKNCGTERSNVIDRAVAESLAILLKQTLN
ncbi:MAG: CinA family nicotinamide mononucleotide deamidase-related protein [Rikenellaceae bacterium]